MWQAQNRKLGRLAALFIVIALVALGIWLGSRELTPVSSASSPAGTTDFFDDFTEPSSGWMTHDAACCLNGCDDGTLQQHPNYKYDLFYDSGRYHVKIPLDCRAGGNHGDTRHIYPLAFAPDTERPLSPTCLEARGTFERWSPYLSFWGLVFAASDDKSTVWSLEVNNLGDWAVAKRTGYDFPGPNAPYVNEERNYEEAYTGGHRDPAKAAYDSNTLRAEVNGENVKLYINGEMIHEFADPEIMSLTKVGLIGGNWEITPTQIGYDYFELDIGCDGQDEPPPNVGVSLGPNWTAWAKPGQNMTYQHTIENTGVSTDTFSVDVLSTQGWPVGLSAQTHVTQSQELNIQLGPQMSSTIELSLTVPSHVDTSTEVTILTATSQLSPTIQATAVDTTTVGHMVHLPAIMNRWPPLPYRPTLEPISNSDGDGSYTVTWTEQPSRLAEEYTLQEATNTAFTVDVRQVCRTSSQSCSVVGRSAGRYYYRVQGHNTWGDSQWSDLESVAVLPPTIPSIVPINNADGDQDYAVTWNTTARAVSYELQEDTGSDFESAETVHEGSANSWEAAGKAPGTYYYRVRALGPTGQSGWSDTESVVVPTQPVDTGNVVITHIHVDGAGRSEPDEYVEIRNDDSAPIQLSGWTLRDDANHVFTFPSHIMQPGDRCRVYTNEYHSVWCGFSYGSGSAIWNNTGDCAFLRNSLGSPIDTYCY